MIETAEDLPRPTIAEAIQIVRMYQPPAERAGEKRWRGTEAECPMRPAKEIFDELSERVAEIEREEAQERIAARWTQDETGYPIPPGGERAA